MNTIFDKKNLPQKLHFFLSALLFFLPWQTVLIFQKWELGTVGIFGFEILFWIVAAVFFVWYFQNKKQPTKMSWLFVTSVVFLGFCFLSILWSPEPMVAFFQSIRMTEAFLLLYILTVVPFDRYKAAGWFIAGSTVQALLGIYQFLTQSTVSFKWLGLVAHPVMQTGTSVIQSLEVGRWLRAYGAFPHPNVLGGYLVVGIIFTTLFLFQKNIQNKKITFLSLLVQSAALFFTFSRSAWIAAVLWFGGLLGYSLVKKYKKEKSLRTKNIPHIVFSFFLFISIVSLFYFPLVKTRIRGESYHEVRSIEERIGGSKFAFDLWKTAPLSGVGVGNYVPAMFEFSPHQERWVYEPVHVVPLLMLTELGIFGFSFFLLVVFFYRKSIPFGDISILVSLSLFPLLILDHYLYSLPVGLFLGAVVVGLSVQFFHTLSPPQEQN